MASRIARSPSWVAGTLLLATVAGGGGILAVWKGAAVERSAKASASQPEPSEVVTSAVAAPRTHRPSTTAVGTVLALRSVTLRNELAGTVRTVRLTPGEIVGPGAVLVALDVSVEAASLKADEARAALAETMLKRLAGLLEHNAVSAEEVDRARAERAVALAEIARIKAVIARKTIRAPFRARVGLADVHPGQYLPEGTVLTTLQGVEAAAHVDFTVAQNVAAGLRVGDSVTVTVGETPAAARIVAIDARVDPATRNALVRARMKGDVHAGPGAAVRVRVPAGEAAEAVVVPVSALRKGPEGDHVFVIVTDDQGKARAQFRPVHAGEVLGDEVMIVRGLKPGEQVAASGAFKLREGVLVTLAGATAEQGNGGK
ncbi:MAG: efflux RND transporter periplasmic adaptor subunit [Gemmatimonadales bacterium]